MLCRARCYESCFGRPCRWEVGEIESGSSYTSEDGEYQKSLLRALLQRKRRQEGEHDPTAKTACFLRLLRLPVAWFFSSCSCELSAALLASRVLLLAASYVVVDSIRSSCY